MLIRQLPNAITITNLIFGFLSISSSFTGDYQNAAIFILIGMMLDSMDGWLARKLGAESAFGKEMDSLADIITFGVAPAILIFGTTFASMGMIGMLIAGMFPVFGAIRLARFNIDEESSVKRYFTGVPITAAGGIIALLTLFSFIVPDAALSAVYTLLCVLMVSKLKIPSLKGVPIPKYAILTTILLISLLYVTRFNASIDYSNWIIFAIILYLVYMVIHFVLKKSELTRNSELAIW